jgi:hypothetical protein
MLFQRKIFQSGVKASSLVINDPSYVEMLRRGRELEDDDIMIDDDIYPADDDVPLELPFDNMYHFIGTLRDGNTFHIN